MSELYSGGCACGAVRFETSSDPIGANHCQCRDCQRRSGTGHASYLVFPRRANMTVTGTLASWRVAGDSGNDKEHSFCPNCGAPVLLTLAALPELVAVHAASLDDPARFQPTQITYAASGQPWDQMDPALQRFEGQPPG